MLNLEVDNGNVPQRILGAVSDGSIERTSEGSPTEISLNRRISEVNAEKPW